MVSERLTSLDGVSLLVADGSMVVLLSNSVASLGWVPLVFMVLVLSGWLLLLQGLLLWFL
jgi:hypothetical protein